MRLSKRGIVLTVQASFAACVAILVVAATASAAPMLVVDAGAGADLVINNSGGTHDSEAVPPSGAANIYGSVDPVNSATMALLSSGNSNASLAYSVALTDGLVVKLLNEDFGGTDFSVYGFDILGSDGLTLLYDGGTDAGNNNTGDAAIADGSSVNLIDTDLTVWNVAFDRTLNGLGFDRVQNVGSTPGGGGAATDALSTLTFTIVPVPEPTSLVLVSLSLVGCLMGRRRS